MLKYFYVKQTFAWSMHIFSKRLSSNLPRTVSNDLVSKLALDDCRDLIEFNSILDETKLRLSWTRNRAKELAIESCQRQQVLQENAKPVYSLALKYLVDDKENAKHKYEKRTNVKNSIMKTEPLENVTVKNSVIGMKYDESEPKSNAERSNEILKRTPILFKEDEFKPDSIEEEDFTLTELSLHDIKFKDPMFNEDEDSSVPPSKVPCGGCGAHLQCISKSEPGFVPSGLFKNVPDKHLRAMICQRCHFLKNYDTALNVNVTPEDYPKIISKIKRERALVLLVVDLTDFPCSIWPQLSQVIGENRPVCVVANKLDLLPADSPNYLNHVKELVYAEVQRVTGINNRNLKHVALVSAKTGFGIEELVNKLFNSWKYKGDVYLVGCTNVGKSSLFNALIKSDYCKVKAVDIVRRATTSPWPGTTLNILKFPILRPDKGRLFVRTMRFIAERDSKAAETKLKELKVQKTRSFSNAQPTGHVGLTFMSRREEVKDPFSMQLKPALDYNPGFGLDPNDPDFSETKWCYDTPGTVQPDQVLHLLTEEELEFTLPQVPICPRTFKLMVGQSLFIAGLGRLDFMSGTYNKSILMTVFASNELPITVCWSQNADKLYSSLLGSELLLVPVGDPERLDKWPGLTAGQPVELKGNSWKYSCADILLSSAGWVSITMDHDLTCTFIAHTPGAKGIYVRQPSLLPKAVNLKGIRMKNSPAYRKSKPIVKNLS